MFPHIYIYRRFLYTVCFSLGNPIKAMKYPPHCRQPPCKSQFTTMYKPCKLERIGRLVARPRIKRVSPTPTIDDLVNASRASFCTMHVQSATGRSNQLLVPSTMYCCTAVDLHTSPYRAACFITSFNFLLTRIDISVTSRSRDARVSRCAYVGLVHRDIVKRETLRSFLFMGHGNRKRFFL